MTFVYVGNVEKLRNEVAEYQDRINDRYRELLGSNRFQKLEDVVKKVLTPNSFFNTLEDFQKIFPGVKTSGTGSSNNFSISSVRPEIYENGRLVESSGMVSSAFYISEDSFAKSASATFTDKIIGGYIHEFNHFVAFALQERPLELITAVVNNLIGEYYNSPDKVIKLIEAQSTNQNTQNRRELLNLVALAYQYDFQTERTTRILDKNVLDSIGIKVNHSWRDKDLKMAHLTPRYDKGMTIKLLIDGDPFKGVDDKEVINRALDWETNFKPINEYHFSDQFLDSIKCLTLEKVSLDDFLKRNVRT